MKYLVDAQLPPVLAQWLREAGYSGTCAVREVGLRDASDEEIWEWASLNQMVVISKDEDFVLKSQRQDTGASVVWLRIGNTTNVVLRTWLLPRMAQITEVLKQGTRLIEVR
jgi:predicted nuclease of predicted toxin-antitoxin system